MAPKPKRQLKNVIPNMALTSEECMNYFKSKERQKEEEEKKKEERLKKREEKKNKRLAKKEIGKKNGSGGLEGKGKGKPVKGKAGMKKKRKGQKATMARTDGDTMEDDEVMELDKSDGSDEDMIVRRVNENECFTCGGEFKKDEGNQWVGCNKCIRWFHKRCVVSIDLCGLDDEQLEALDFECDLCLSGF